MAGRFKRVVDVATGRLVDVAYTQAEEDAADADAAAWAQHLADQAANTPDFGDGSDQADLTSGARAAVQGLRAYVALASPTAAQTTAAVKLLCRIVLWFIRRQFP